MARAKVGNEIKAVGDANARIQRPLGRGLDHRSIGDRVGERNPDLDHVGTARDQGVEQGSAGLQTRIAEHEECAERALAALRELAEHGGVAAHSNNLCAWATSLSPRPDRPTTITASGFSSASFSPCARACADSNAHKIPSFSARALNAASASTSVTPTYWARP